MCRSIQGRNVDNFQELKKIKVQIDFVTLDRFNMYTKFDFFKILLVIKHERQRKKCKIGWSLKVSGKVHHSLNGT